MAKRDEFDPRELILESYRIEGISAEQCRSIFMDWALSISADADPKKLIAELLGRHEVANGDHPMTAVLREGQGAVAKKGRRGGRAGRLAT